MSWPVPIRWPYRCEPSEPKHWAMAKNTAMALARTSSGKISETVRYPAEAPAEAKKKITDQHSVWVTAFSVPALNSCAVMTSRMPDTR